MSPYSVLVQKQARALRLRGYSFAEISRNLGVAKSTASVWTRDVSLSRSARERLARLGLDGRCRGRAVRLAGRDMLNRRIQMKVRRELNSARKLDPTTRKLLLAFLFWCEGTKNLSVLCFTNSDPNMIVTFLELFRSTFELDETKLRYCLHLHGYHNEQKQLDYWSKITHIPRSQFMKVYHKPNGKKRIRNNYQGCLSLRYYDSSKAKELYYFYQEFIGA